MEFRGVDSFGNGGNNIGSHRIVTLNFYRLCRRFQGNDEELAKYIREYLNGAAKVLRSHRNLIKDMIDLGFLKFFTLGWINLDRMFFSTIGINGIWEGLRELGINVRTDEGLAIAGQHFDMINREVTKLSNKFKMPINIEQIPAESAAITLAKKDALYFNDDEPRYSIYANQFVPLWEDVDLWERAKIDGYLDRHFSGGLISHLNISSKPTKRQMRKLIEHAVSCKLSHFALNPVYSKCLECGDVSFGRIDTCPKCENKVIEYMTRIVGYFTPVSGWVKHRREWEFGQRKWKELGDKK